MFVFLYIQLLHHIYLLHQAVTQSLADCITRLEDNNSREVSKILWPATSVDQQNIAASGLLWDYKPPTTLSYLRTTYAAELQASAST